MTERIRRVIIEADGGSRGNPGPAGYGAVLRDVDTDRVLAEEGSTIGRATNNVAEYSGLIAGLRLARDHAPDAEIEVRMDSKLVVEQMSGRWKIKHPSMQPLAAQAAALAPAGTSYSWIPRERNKHADRLANEAMDGMRDGVTVAADEDSLIEEIESPAAAAAGDPPASLQSQARGWSATSQEPTTLILVRHGVTAHTVEKRFSGGLASANPPLSDEGREQVRATAEWLAPIAEKIEVVIASPVRRTRESAEIVAEVLGKALVEEPGFAEMEFGIWDGMTFGEVAKAHPKMLDAWLGSIDAAPEGGESFSIVEERVLAGLQRVLSDHAGETVVVVSHVTPIKTLVSHAVNAPLDSVFRMELSPASVTVVSFFGGGADGDEPRTSMRLYNALPPARDAFADPTRW
ncbi:bifunctional RNase H/acid phosphatase [Nocardioides psychrotolerans]|uniref:Probable phosphoglycerate mutase n=1 Tax=Nocardioides psychrotolerans TaxID=1005945 RepID=A0A1I3P1K7_9ACTN|nr:bifunctional RNase H/acid phosphatase [Nocardioides psychrotolerans]GEP39553.1 bifunctional RNase H/acid phosphatase [Nocardioides psychrotolerans]SFJ15433.1 probable phosphoglycerate mutase [Nocardioides psychrotolerans]